ncbi:hypothetical protein ACSP97_00925 [Streptomyces sp. SCPE 10]|uniref:hypothetical protein n=1 Tax=Streptomyces TaxID=1883 RepID=UPI0033C03AA8
MSILSKRFNTLSEDRRSYGLSSVGGQAVDGVRAPSGDASAFEALPRRRRHARDDL